MPMSKLSGKRAHCSTSSSDEGEAEGSRSQPKRRHHALVSYILTAIKEVIKQEIRTVAADTIREMIKEEWQRMNSQHAKPLERTPSRCLERGDGRSLQLHFKTPLLLPLYTWKQIEGEKGAPVSVALIDANTGHVVASGPEASTKLDVVVLEGDFNQENNSDWTREKFESYQVREREGRAPLLAGDLQVTLKEGVAVLGKLKFTDNSSWNRSKMYRIGLKVASGHSEGVRIREAITEALRIKDQRGESKEKHYPAKPDDAVWRLNGIGRDGPYHKRLNKKGIANLEDFLREFVRDPKGLRNLLGVGMTDNKWRDLIDHAQSCVQSGKHYQYCYDEERSVAVVFDITGQLKGYTVMGCFHPPDPLVHNLKDLDDMVRRAYSNWDCVKEYNGANMQNSVSGGYSDQSFRHMAAFNAPAPTEHSPGGLGMAVEGYETAIGGSVTNIQNDNLNIAIQNSPMDSISLPEAPLYLPTFYGQSTPSCNLHEGQGSRGAGSLQDDLGTDACVFDSDDEFWRMFLQEDTPSPNLPQTCKSRAAVVSWLRIKAVFKWGFFVRKIVTNKVRPTIEQLN